MIKKENLKHCRKMLKLNQIDLSGVGMSREYISDVERGKSVLTLDKAKIIIKKLMLYSIHKNILIPLELDDSDIIKLDLVDEYKSFKMLMKFKDESNTDNKLLISLIEIADNPSSEFRFFIYSKISEVYLKEGDYLVSYTYRKNAIEILFSINYENSIFNLNENLRLLRDLAFKIEKPDDMIRYYRQIIKNNHVKNRKCEPFTYYNLALFEKISHDYSNAIKHLYMELSENEPISSSDYYDIILLIASMSFRLEKIDDAMKIYNDIIKKNFISLNENQKSMSASNFIYFYVRNNISNHPRLIRFFEGYLLDSIKKNPHDYQYRYRVFANLGLLRQSQLNFKEAIKYFEKAYDIYFNTYDNITLGYIHLLDESLSVYYNSSSWNTYLKFLNKTVFDDLNKEIETKFLKIVSRVLFLDTDRSSPLILALKKYTYF